MKSDGFALLRSLITLAVLLTCIAGFLAALAAAAKHNGHLETRIKEEFLRRNEKTMERLK